MWAFGAVVYEMLTGRRAFTGDDVSDTLAAVLRAEVALDELPSETPIRLRQVLTACLQREPKQRVHDMADVRLAMEGAFETTVSTSSEPAAPTLPLPVMPKSSYTPSRNSMASSCAVPKGAERPSSRPMANGWGLRSTTLQKVSILGGPPVTLMEAEAQILGASWGRDDQIIFGSRLGLFRVSGAVGGCSHVVIATFEPLCGKETVEVLGWQKHVFAVCG